MKTRLLFIFVCVLVSLSLLLTACAAGSTTQASSSTSTTGTTSTHTTAATSTSTETNNSLINILGMGKDINSIKFDITMTVTGQPPITMTVWQKQQKMREDMTMQGITVSILYDIPSNVMYTYLRDQNMATKTALDMNMIPNSPIENASDILDYSPNITGTETIDGKVCKVIEYNEAGISSVKMWLWEEKGLPLKMEVTADGTTTTIEYNNIDLTDIPDSIFEIPEGVIITEA
jgi:outer membrane lipoprotein-sorting protein